MAAELAESRFGPAAATLEFDYDGDRALGRRGLRPPLPRVSVVVPAKDEAANISEVLPYLSSFFEVIVVVSENDHESARAAVEALPSARVIYQTRKGKGNALVCGFEEANGDVIVTFDVDGSADPHEIPRFVEALTRGADLAKGSRFCSGGGSQDITQFRALGNRGLNVLASAMTGTRFSDLCYGFNAFWADQLPVLCLPDTDADTPQHGDGFEIETLIIGRFAFAKAIIIEVPSYEYDRYHGETNLNAVRDGFRVLWTILKDRFHGRRYRDLASRLRASGTVVGKPFWMLANPRAEELKLPAPTFPPRSSGRSTRRGLAIPRCPKRYGWRSVSQPPRWATTSSTTPAGGGTYVSGCRCRCPAITCASSSSTTACPRTWTWHPSACRM
jgi:glycosyltransferase involved in cell wall biosynthesis